MSKSIYDIKLSNIVQGGVPCSNPVITWEKLDCVDIVCEFNNGILRVEVPDYCDDKCLYVTIDCTNECAACDPQTIKICPCDTTADCPDCHSCIDDVCVSLCDEDEFCIDDECRECRNNDDCPDGQVCLNGKCVCPPDKPYFVDGKCKDCADDTDCPPCYRCGPNGCEPIVCPIGKCNPENNECVECLRSGDCTGENECCVNNKCECCEGFYRNPDTGKCEPNPPCSTDGQCPDCYICNENGECVPQTCPPGYVNTGGSPCCQPECDCANPSCPSGRVCVPLSGDPADYLAGDETCYCKACEGDCTDNDDCNGNSLIPSCICDGEGCAPNPCFGPCHDGGDCGPGCGCDENGWCVPCDTLDCQAPCVEVDGCECNGNNCEEAGCSGFCINSDDCGPGCGCYFNNCVPCSEIPCDSCNLVPGCECTDGVNCTASPCAEPCTGGEDCGPGCGCYNQSCISCEAVSCAEHNDCPEGCYCGPDGQCLANPCAGDCSNSGDCPNGCDCEDGTCVPCGANCDDKDDPCNDVWNLFKDEQNCDLVVTRKSSDCCQCADLSIGGKVVANSNQVLDVEVQLRQGSANNWDSFLTLPLLSDTGVDNELPLSGVVVLTLEQRLVGNQLNTIRRTLDVTQLDTGTVTIPGILVQNVVSNTLYIGVEQKIVFPNNCEHTGDFNDAVIFTNQSGLPLAKNAYTTERLTNCRKPLLTWYKSAAKNNIFASDNIVRKFYAKKNPSGTGFTDRLVDWDLSVPTGDFRLETCKYYGVSTDCGCDRDVVYTCGDGDDQPRRLTFCHPTETLGFTDFRVSKDACGDNVIFDFDVVIDCDVMIHEPNRSKYRVYIDATGDGSAFQPATLVLPSGTNVQLVQPDDNGLLIPEGAYINANGLDITTVRLKQECEDCNWVVDRNVRGQANLESTLVIGTDECAVTTEVNFTATINGGVAPYSISVVSGTGVVLPITVGSQTDVNTATGINTNTVSGTIDITSGNEEYVLQVTDSSGCTLNSDTVEFTDPTGTPDDYYDYSITCLSNGDFTIDVSTLLSSRVTVEVQRRTGADPYTTFGNSTLVLNSSTTGNTGSLTLKYNDAYDYQVVFDTDPTGCSYTDTFDPNCPIDVALSYETPCFLPNQFGNDVWGPWFVATNLSGPDIWVNVVDSGAPTVTLFGTWKKIGAGQTATFDLEDTFGTYQAVHVTDFNDISDSGTWVTHPVATISETTCCSEIDERINIVGDCDGASNVWSVLFPLGISGGNHNITGIITADGTEMLNGTIVDLDTVNVNFGDGNVELVVTLNFPGDTTGCEFTYNVECTEAKIECNISSFTASCNTDGTPSLYINNTHTENLELYVQNLDVEGDVISEETQQVASGTAALFNSSLFSEYGYTVGYRDPDDVNGCAASQPLKCEGGGPGTGDVYNCEPDSCLQVGGFPAIYEYTLTTSEGTYTYSENITSGTQLQTMRETTVPNWINSITGANSTSFLGAVSGGEFCQGWEINGSDVDIISLEQTYTQGENPPATSSTNYSCTTGSIPPSEGGTCTTDNCLSVPIDNITINVTLTESGTGNVHTQTFNVNSSSTFTFWNTALPLWVESQLPGSSVGNSSSGCVASATDVVRKLVVSNSPVDLTSLTFEIINGTTLTTETSPFTCV